MDFNIVDKNLEWNVLYVRKLIDLLFQQID